MRAAICREFAAPLSIEPVSLADPAWGEVRVKVGACAICSSDLSYIDGLWGGALPAVFGHEAAGAIDAVGPGVETLRVGDHVVVTLIRSCGHCHYCAQGRPVRCEHQFPLDVASPLRDRAGDRLKQGLRTGAFAEFVTVDASQVCPVPKNMPFDSASLLACGVITGLGAVWNTARMPPGAHVAVIGTGGVGLNTVQGAALAGAATIVAIDTACDKLDVARSFGATHTIHPLQTDPVIGVRSASDGRGADFVFITVGAKRAIDQSIDMLAPGGSAVIVGMPASGVMGHYEAADFASAEKRIIGSKMGSSVVSTDIPRLVELYQQGRLKLDELITGRYPFDAINDAIASSRRGDALRNVLLF